jgi:uncharacterized protein
MQWIPCYLSHLLLDEQHDHMVFLAERDGDRRLSFVIGPAEAATIERGIKGRSFMRPLTHDLLLQVISATGFQLHAVRVIEVRDGTFYAELLLQDRDGHQRTVDCRPSDGLALLTRHEDCSLLVAEPLLEETDGA